MGSPDFAVPCLRALAQRHEVVLVVSQPDKPAGRGGTVTPPPVKVAAIALGIPVVQPRSARNGELRDVLLASGAELAAVVAYGKILPADVLTALPRGCINVHASILPKYRGAAPVQWSVIHGETETGVDVMQLDEGMDTGPVLLEARTTIGPEETAGELLGRLSAIGAAALLETIADLALGRAAPVPQNHDQATHAPMLQKSDGAIDFGRAAAAVAARIRGVDPWPGAQVVLRGQPMKLFRAVPEPASTTTATPGTVVAIDAAGLHVACGEGAVVIREVQAAGKKRMAATVFATGRGIAVGDVLGTPTVEAAAVTPVVTPVVTPG